MTQQEKAQEAINYARFKQQQLALEKAKRAQELGNNLDSPQVSKRPRTPRTRTGQAVSGLAGAVSDAVKNKARALNPVPRVVNTARGVDRIIADKINSLTSPDQIPQGSRNLRKVSTPKGKLRKTQAQVDAEARALKQSRFDKLNIAPRKGTSLRIDSPRMRKVKNALAQERAMGTGHGGMGYTAQDFIRDAKGNKLIPKPTSVAKPGFDDLVSDAKAGTVVGVHDPFTDEIYYSSGGNPVDSKGNYVFPYDEDFERQRVNFMYEDFPGSEYGDFPGGQEPHTNKLPDDSIRQKANKALKALKTGGKLLTPFADPIGFMADMKSLSEASDAERGVIGYEPRPAEFIPTNRMVPDMPLDRIDMGGTAPMQPEMVPNPERRSDFDHFYYGPKPIYSPEAEMYRRGA